MMWIIAIQCIAVVCGPPMEVKQFRTQAQCEAQIIKIAKAFDPGNGAYSFNCRKVG